tara:strand:+ start:2554 stop:2949 length:396 start_codon:yes stop_codon:yes gene_type:complete
MSDTITLLSTNTFSNSATLQSEKAKGDAYFGMSDGLHTVLVDLNDFIGTIKIQGSLVTDPTASDWFDADLSNDEYTVDTTGKVTDVVLNNLTYALAETSKKSYNAIGNFVWLRADVSNWTAGTITKIELNR